MFLNNYHCILLNYTLALLHQYTEHHLFMYCFFLPMQLVNGTQFLNIIFSLALFAACPAAAVFRIVLVPLTSIYAKQHKQV